MSDQSGSTPAGWYPDPQGGGGQRYWDGERWTDEVTAPSDAPPGGPQPTAEYGTVWMRFFARLIDGLIYGIPFGIVMTVIGLGPGDGSGESFVFNAAVAVVGVLYFTFLESSTGQTPGKKMLGLRTVGPDGGVPTQEQAFKRNAWYLIGIIPTFIGGLISVAVTIWIAVQISNTGRGPHDGWAGGTAVIKTS